MSDPPPGPSPHAVASAGSSAPVKRRNPSVTASTSSSCTPSPELRPSSGGAPHHHGPRPSLVLHAEAPQAARPSTTSAVGSVKMRRPSFLAGGEADPPTLLKRRPSLLGQNATASATPARTSPIHHEHGSSVPSASVGGGGHSRKISVSTRGLQEQHQAAAAAAAAAGSAKRILKSSTTGGPSGHGSTHRRVPTQTTLSTHGLGLAGHKRPSHSRNLSHTAHRPSSSHTSAAHSRSTTPINLPTNLVDFPSGVSISPFPSSTAPSLSSSLSFHSEFFSDGGGGAGMPHPSELGDVREKRGPRRRAASFCGSLDHGGGGGSADTMRSPEWRSAVARSYVKAQRDFELTRLQGEKATLVGELEEAKLVIADMRYAAYRKEAEWERKVAFYRHLQLAAERNLDAMKMLYMKRRTIARSYRLCLLSTAASAFARALRVKQQMGELRDQILECVRMVAAAKDPLTGDLGITLPQAESTAFLESSAKLFQSRHRSLGFTRSVDLVQNLRDGLSTLHAGIDATLTLAAEHRAATAAMFERNNELQRANLGMKADLEALNAGRDDLWRRPGLLPKVLQRMNENSDGQQQPQQQPLQLDLLPSVLKQLDRESAETRRRLEEQSDQRRKDELRAAMLATKPGAAALLLSRKAPSLRDREERRRDELAQMGFDEWKMQREAKQTTGAPPPPPPAAAAAVAPAGSFIPRRPTSSMSRPSSTGSPLVPRSPAHAPASTIHRVELSANGLAYHHHRHQQQHQKRRRRMQGGDHAGAQTERVVRRDRRYARDPDGPTRSEEEAKSHSPPVESVQVDRSSVEWAGASIPHPPHPAPPSSSHRSFHLASTGVPGSWSSSSMIGVESAYDQAMSISDDEMMVGWRDDYYGSAARPPPSAAPSPTPPLPPAHSIRQAPPPPPSPPPVTGRGLRRFRSAIVRVVERVRQRFDPVHASWKEYREMDLENLQLDTRDLEAE